MIQKYGIGSTGIDDMIEDEEGDYVRYEDMITIVIEGTYEHSLPTIRNIVTNPPSVHIEPVLHLNNFVSASRYVPATGDTVKCVTDDLEIRGEVFSVNCRCDRGLKYYRDITFHSATIKEKKK